MVTKDKKFKVLAKHLDVAEDCADIKYNKKDLCFEDDTPTIFYYFNEIYFVLTKDEMLEREENIYHTDYCNLQEKILLSILKEQIKVPTNPETRSEQIAKKLNVPHVSVRKYDEVKDFLGVAMRSSSEVFNNYPKDKLLNGGYTSKYTLVDGLYISNITIE